MLIVRLWGGVGNQLFQYAFGCYWKSQLQDSVLYDIASFGQSDKLRSLELDTFFESIPVAKVPKYFFSRYKGIWGRILRLIYHALPFHRLVYEGNLNELENNRFNPFYQYYCQGYWQEKKYADFLLDNQLLKIDLKQIPAEIEFIYNLIVGDKTSVSLHVRRGDYFSSHNVHIYGVCDKLYYERALNLINEREKEMNVYVFSDDLDWVRSNIELPLNVMFIPNFDISQFWYIYLMSLCKHNIISNSTFSWWGAFLNSNKQKLVVSPSRWVLTSDKTLALDDWLKI